MSDADNYRTISRLTDELLDAHEFKPPSPPELDENTVLYQILDHAPQSRKLMNYMIYSRSPNDTNKYRKGPAQKKSLVISHRWLDQEKRANTKTTPASLQLETPVIFSWSKKAHDIKKDQVTKSQQDFFEQESTNHHLYKSVATNLNQIKSRENWNFNDPKPHTMDGEDKQSTRKTEWANPNFKVDPLQPFVAKVIREPKKKAPKKEKAPSKMKNLFGFLSNSTKKGGSNSLDQNMGKRSNDKDEKLPESEAATDTYEEIQEPRRETTEDTYEEQVFPSLRSTIEENSPTPVPSAPPELISNQSFNANSSLSMNSFIPLKPKKKN